MAVGQQRGCRTVNKLNQLIILSLNPAHPQHCAVASGLLWCVKRFGMANALWSVSSALGVGRTRSSRSCIMAYTLGALQGIIQDSGGIPPEQWAVSGMVKKSRAGARDTHASLKPQQKSRKRFYLIPKRRQHEHVSGYPTCPEDLLPCVSRPAPSTVYLHGTGGCASCREGNERERELLPCGRSAR